MYIYITYKKLDIINQQTQFRDSINKEKPMEFQTIIRIGHGLGYTWAFCWDC